MLGDIASDKLIRSGGVQVGDVVVLTKGVAVEATAIMAREREQELSASFAPEFLARCKGFLHDPGISVVRDARIATQAAALHAMHDPTEGGVATGLWELALASAVGLEVDASSIPVFAETRRLCDVLELDPLGVIASGALLIAVSEDAVGALCAALQKAGIAAAPIARATPVEHGCTLRTPTGERSLPRYDQDEIARLF
jgi:hydrogenase maturation factor